MSSPKFKLRTLSSALVAAGLLAAVQPAQALNSFLKSWETLYPTSLSANAGCSLCHGTSTSNLNTYGKDLCVELAGNVPKDVTSYLQAIELDDSDGEVNDNSTEISVNSQPGWTTGANNQLYAADVNTCIAVGAPVNPPSTVPLPYDPPAEGMPVAIPGGPYAGNVNVPITFDGSGSYDSDDIGDGIVSYEWDFGDGATGTGMTAQHTYTVADTYIVSLTVTDDEGDTSTNSTVATVSGNAVLDLDIAALKVTSSVRVGRPIAIQLSVENPGTVLGQALATVTGIQNGLQVYKWSLNVYDSNNKGATSFTFPSYTPTGKGTISWAATIDDANPDADLATATTTVK